jgi:hypothetical protein
LRWCPRCGTPPPHPPASRTTPRPVEVPLTLQNRVAGVARCRVQN